MSSYHLTISSFRVNLPTSLEDRIEFVWMYYYNLDEPVATILRLQHKLRFGGALDYKEFVSLTDGYREILINHRNEFISRRGDDAGVGVLSEMVMLCDEYLEIVGRIFPPPASEADGALVFCYTMAGEFHHMIWHVLTALPGRIDSAHHINMAYSAHRVALSNADGLPATHPSRLTACYAFAKFIKFAFDRQEGAQLILGYGITQALEYNKDEGRPKASPQTLDNIRILQEKLQSWCEEDRKAPERRIFYSRVIPQFAPFALQRLSSTRCFSNNPPVQPNLHPNAP